MLSHKQGILLIKEINNIIYHKEEEIPNHSKLQTANSVGAKQWEDEYTIYDNMGGIDDKKLTLGHQKTTLCLTRLFFLQQLQHQCMAIERRRCKPKTKNKNKEIMHSRRDLEALINKVISHPLDNHVTLSWSQGFFIDAKNQSLASFLYSDTSRALQKWITKQ